MARLRASLSLSLLRAERALTHTHTHTLSLVRARAQQFTGGADGGIHITDASNACRTLLFNLHKQAWCEELCEFFDFPMEALPEVVSNSEVYGVFKKGHLLEGVPIAGLIGDQQAALVGNKCLTKGAAKQTYGQFRILLFLLERCAAFEPAPERRFAQWE